MLSLEIIKSHFFRQITPLYFVPLHATSDPVLGTHLYSLVAALKNIHLVITFWEAYQSWPTDVRFSKYFSFYMTPHHRQLWNGLEGGINLTITSLSEHILPLICKCVWNSSLQGLLQPHFEYFPA